VGVDLPPHLAFAPAERLSPGSSHLFADLILGGWLLVVVGCAAAFALFAWARARRLDAEVWRRRGLRPGPILLPGVAEPADGQREEAPAPFVELTITQEGKEQRHKNSYSVCWTEVARSLSSRPFGLRTESGDHVLVEPGQRIELVDGLDETLPMGAGRRRRDARIVAGERLWIRGVLSRGGQGGEGPYRGGGGEGRWTLRPPARGALFISSEPVANEARGEVRLHAWFAGVFVALLAICQLALFRPYHRLRADGVQTVGTVVSKNTYTTKHKNGVTRHYQLTVTYDVAGHERRFTGDTSVGAYRLVNGGTSIPILRSASAPDVVLLGGAEELGATSGSAVFGTCVGLLIAVTWAFATIGRRPWWRRKRVVETVPGRL
jgi:hypothetical protein